MSHNPDATRRIENRTFKPQELMEEHRANIDFSEYLKFPEQEIDVETVAPVLSPESDLASLSLLSSSLTLAVDLMKSQNAEIDDLKIRLTSLQEKSSRAILDLVITELLKSKIPERDSSTIDAQVVAWTRGFNDGIKESIRCITRLRGVV